jgi:hypothetical protein
MLCVAATCVVECETTGDAAADDAVCEDVSSALTCAESAGNLCVFECVAGACPTGYSCLDPGGENACLPSGSFPGSACGAGNTCAQDLGGNAEADMVCAAGTCVVECATAGNAAADDAVCEGVSSALTCAESAGDLCVFECVAGACPTGYSCLDPGGENACLPTGSFPGGPCGVGDTCGQDLGGNAAADMVCEDNVCVVACDTAGDAAADDALCAGVSDSLTCSESAGDLCVPSCATSACPTDYSCLAFNGEDACLPTGSFPSSPCRATVGDECDEDLLGNDDFDMECTSADLCALRCDGNDDALCAQFDPSWTCSTLAGDVCLIGCGATDPCPAGFSCVMLDEQVCLPD